MLQNLDIIIAFVVVILVASLFIMAATQVVVSFLGLRGVNLRRGLVDLFETVCPGQEASLWAKEIARRVLRYPATSDSIFARFRLRADRLPFIPPETAGKLQSMGASIPLLPLIMGAVGGLFLTPIAMAIAKHWFADVCQYAGRLASYTSVLNFCDHPWRTGAFVGAILGGLLSRWRVATFIRMEELPVIFERLAEPLPGTLPDPAQRAMLLMAWGDGESGAKSRPAAPQENGLVRAKPSFDEGIVRHAWGLSEDERLSPAEDFDEGIVRHAVPVQREASVAVAMENATASAQWKKLEPDSTPDTPALTSIPAPSGPRLEVLRAWFDYVMDRASQRFAFEARLLTIVLSCIFVFAAHFDAVRLLQSMSQGAELRARLAATAEALDKQADQLSRAKESAHNVVPDVYREAMVSILRIAPAAPGQAKRKLRSNEREKVAATATAPGEDSVTSDAKSKAMRDLETVPGFTSREEAESWLRATLDGNPAGETLAAAYQQEVNVQLVSNSAKLIDQFASLKRELARSEFKLFQDERPRLSSSELPGLLITIALLSLGAAFCYNTLKNLASLHPQFVARQARERKHAVHP